LVREDGTGLVALTETNAEERSPAWSPEGRRVAFHVEGRKALAGIFVTRLRGPKAKKITVNPADHSPAWSPDGSRIVFVSSQPQRPNERDLYVMNANGSGRKRLTKTQALQEDGPAWSPDGTRIAFSSFDKQNIYLISSFGGRPKRIARGGDPSWSADGSVLGLKRGSEAYFIVRPDGTAERRLAANIDPTDQPGKTAWSPDGNAIAIVLDTGDTEACLTGRFVEPGIGIVNADGTGLRLPLGCATDNFDPDWQPVCTLYGTDRDEVLVGTPGNDVICALRGNDRIAASAGDDVVIGGDGNDVIFGGPGQDRLFGSAGEDKLFAKDGEVEDVTNGGPGRDVAIVDGPDDRPWEVERTVR
jgi:dipeptidyl aminopeptidase/acylaminoacyl peptidase